MKLYPRETCCFATGHRDLPEHKRSEILGRIRETAEWLISQNVTHFYAGGAKGFDMWFACVLLELKKAHPHITLTLMLPAKDYSYSWTPEEKLLQAEIERCADETVTVPPEKNREPALTRDDALIAAAAHCVYYLKNNKVTPRGGTSYTVRKATAAHCNLYAIFKAGDLDLMPAPNPKRRNSP